MKLFKGYYKPTPVKMRKLGDALLAVSLSMSGYAIFEEYKALAVAGLIIGGVGKFLTNFYSESK